MARFMMAHHLNSSKISLSFKGTDWFGNKKTAGVVGSNVYIVVEDNTVSCPFLTSGKDKEAVADLIKERLAESLTANMTKAYTDEEGFDQEAFDEDFGKWMLPTISSRMKWLRRLQMLQQRSGGPRCLMPR